MYVTLYIEDAPGGGIVRVPERRKSFQVSPGATVADICLALCEENPS